MPRTLKMLLFPFSSAFRKEFLVKKLSVGLGQIFRFHVGVNLANSLFQKKGAFKKMGVFGYVGGVECVGLLTRYTITPMPINRKPIPPINKAIP